MDLVTFDAVGSQQAWKLKACIIIEVYYGEISAQQWLYVRKAIAVYPPRIMKAYLTFMIDLQWRLRWALPSFRENVSKIKSNEAIMWKDNAHVFIF